MNLQPTLKGQLITISPLMDSDLEDLYQAASDPLIWEQHPSDRHIRSEFELFFQKAMESKGAFKVIDNQTTRIIGSSRYYDLDLQNKTVMVGYTFLERTYWGGKYNFEMKNLMLNHAFQFVDTVFFQIDEMNHRSQKALEKIGGKFLNKTSHGDETLLLYEIKKETWNSKSVPSKSDQLREQIDSVRILLLEIHKMLIDQGRADYEKQHGEIHNPGDWVRLLVGDAFFSWLHPLSKLITTIDELLEIELPIREIDGKAVRAEIENIIGDFPTTPKDFRTHYLDIIQREPNVVIKLSKLKQGLQKLPKPEPDKMGDLLNIRQQWSAAIKLKYFRPTKKQ